MNKIEKLVLDKYKEPVADSDELVNAEKYFNGNYTKIENKVNEVIDNTDTRLNTLETDNTQNKQNILSIQQEQIKQNTNISQNKTDIELLEENLSDEITTEEAESLTVKDATRWYSKLDVSGNSVQEQTSQSANLLDKSKFVLNQTLAGTGKVGDKYVFQNYETRAYLLFNCKSNYQYTIISDTIKVQIREMDNAMIATKVVSTFDNKHIITTTENTNILGLVLEKETAMTKEDIDNLKIQVAERNK